MSVESNAQELERLDEEIAKLGAQVEERRQQMMEILKGKIATASNGQTFIIQSAKIYQGGSRMRIFFEGPLLRRSGTPHARTRCSSTLSLLTAIREAP